MSENKTNALINIEGKVAEKVYDDAGSQAAKKLGLALSTIADIPNTLLSPIKWANERVQLFFDNNNAKYKQRLEAIPEEKIVPVPTEIAIPILNRFQYVTNEALSEAFVNLLANASSSDTAALAHPSFVSIIDRLSPDEAKVLQLFGLAKAIPCLTLGFYTDLKEQKFVDVLVNATGVEKDQKLLFPSNIGVYFNNLTSLGLIELTDYYYVDLEEQYRDIEAEYSEEISTRKPERALSGDDAIKREQSMFKLTDYGELFISAISNKDSHGKPKL